MTRLLCQMLLVGLLFCVAASPSTAPSRPGYRLVNRQWISTTTITSWQELLTASIVEGQLEIAVSIDPTLQSQFRSGRRLAAEIGESSLVWILTVSEFKAGEALRRGVYLRAAGIPAAPVTDDRYRLSAIVVEPTGTVIRGQGRMDNRVVQCELRHDRVKNFISLQISDTAPGQQPRGLQANAVDLRMLLFEHGDAMRLYVVPLLSELAGEPILRPRAADVYRLFPDIPASPKARARLARILDRLADADPRVRTAADDELNLQGDDVVLAALRATNLNPPQQGAIRRFLMRRQLLLESQIERMREEMSYQIDLLDFDDRAVRERAKAMIERLTDEKIEFDLDLEGSRRTEAVEQFRLLLTRPLD